MQPLKLVREFTKDNIITTKEEVAGKKSWVIEGIGIQMNVVNANERLYTKEPMLEQLEIYKKEYLDKDRAVAEFEHPVDPDDQVRVNMERICAKFIDMIIDGDNVILKAVPTKGTHYGDTLIGLLENGVQLGFSSRALATLEEKNGYTETRCEKIITLADIVYDPSAPDAFIQGVMEGKEWIIKDGIVMEAKSIIPIIETAQEKFKNMTSKTKIQVAKQVMEEYFNALFTKSK